MIPGCFKNPVPAITSLLATFLLFNTVCAQQNNPLINSGELLKEGAALHEARKYKDALEVYRKISRSDTNYADALYEMSYACYADSQLTAAHNYALEGMSLFPERFTKYALLDGNVLDMMKRTAEAIQLYDEALKRNPHNSGLHFNKAITLIKDKQLAEGKKALEQCLLINPYFYSAHYLLGALYYDAGNCVAAMLAFKTYLMLEPGGKYNTAAVGKLDNIARVTDEVVQNVKKYKPGKEDNFDLQQQILLSKISHDKQYKLKAELEDYIVRQIQVVDEKLEYNRNDKGFCMQYYVPFYIKTFKEDQFEPMIFTMFSGLNLKSVQSWNNKNKKKVEAFATTAVDYLNEIRNKRTLNALERKAAPVWYYFEDGSFAGKGGYVQNGEDFILTGYWEFYYDNGMISAKGEYNSDGKKTGEWNYYYNSGQLKEKTAFKAGVEQGLSEGWFDNGNPWYSETYADGKLEGIGTIYYYSGILKSTVNYKAGEKEGIEKNYNIQGSLASTQQYSSGKKSGEGITYFSSGKVQDRLNYTDDKAQGAYKSFYNSGAIEEEGGFTDDMRQGLWISYFENGKVKAKTTYLDNEITGEFTEYFEDGKLSQKGNYTKKKIDGKLESYDDDGILFHDAVYEKGKLREINFYDKKGKNISSTTTRRGAADITFYSAEGLKTSQGYFNKEGSKDGKFTEYFASGKISDESLFKDGVEDGVSVSYYNNGQKKLEHNFTDGEENGYVKGYFYNGKLNYEGWVINGSKQQQIIYYNSFGDITQKAHYLNDEQDGYTEFKYPGNIPDYEYKYSNGWLQESTQFDSTGKVISKNIFKNGSGPVVYKHYNGAIAGMGNYNHYLLTGLYKIFYFDGTPASVAYFVNDERDSVFKEYFYGGVLKTVGSYKNGHRQGTWKYYYPNGKLREEATYKNDLLEGEDKTYKEDGTLDKVMQLKNNELHGEFKSYGENNQLAFVLYFKEGILQSYSYEDKTGKLVAPIVMKAASGKVITYYKNGTQSADFTYLDNDMEGPRKLFYSNGKLYAEGTRKFGYEDGIKKVYYPSGTLMKEENLVLGNLHGLSKTWHPNGKPEKEENYYNDELHGTCKYFDAGGKLKQTMTYFHGNLLSVQ